MDDTLRAEFAERRRSAARDIQRRLVAHIAAGCTTDFAPGPMENDPAVYTDPARADLEIRELFLKLPLLAGLSQDIDLPGDVLLFEEAGQSILIVRDRDGLVRAFRNMCMHRGSKLVCADADGSCPAHARFTCPFHAWSYDLDGRLTAVPGRQGFEGIDLSRRNLLPVAVSEWQGMIFVRAADADEPLDIPAYLGKFADELAQLEMSEAEPVQSSRLTAATNWKYALDTYAEGYHFGTLHASTIGRTHYSNVAVFDEFGPHWRIVFPEKGLKALVGLPEKEFPDPDYHGIHFLFPNTVLVVSSVEPGQGFLRIFRLFPGPTAGTMACCISVYAPGGEIPGEYRAQLVASDAESEVTQEDYGVAVDGYANLVRAPADFRLVYGRNEPAVQSFHRHVADLLQHR